MFPGKTAGKRKSSFGKNIQETELVCICNNSSIISKCLTSLTPTPPPPPCHFLEVFGAFQNQKTKINNFPVLQHLLSLSFHISLLFLMVLFLQMFMQTYSYRADFIFYLQENGGEPRGVLAVPWARDSTMLFAQRF